MRQTPKNSHGQPFDQPSPDPNTPSPGEGLFRSRSFRSATCQFSNCLRSGRETIRLAAPPHVGGRTLLRHFASWPEFDPAISIVRVPSIAMGVDVRLEPLELGEWPQFLDWAKRHQHVGTDLELSPLQQLARYHQTGGCIGLLRRSLEAPAKSNQDSRSEMRASS